MTAETATSTKPLARREANDLKRADNAFLTRAINKVVSDMQQKVLVAGADADLVIEVLRHYVLVHQTKNADRGELHLACIFEARDDAPEYQVAWELWQDLRERAQLCAVELKCENEKLMIAYFISRIDDQLSFKYRQQLIKEMRDAELQHFF